MVKNISKCNSFKEVTIPYMYKNEEDYHNYVIVASHMLFTSYNCKTTKSKVCEVTVGMVTSCFPTATTMYNRSCLDYQFPSLRR